MSACPLPDEPAARSSNAIEELRRLRAASEESAKRFQELLERIEQLERRIEGLAKQGRRKPPE